MKTCLLPFAALSLAIVAGAPALAGEKSDKVAERLAEFEKTGEVRNCLNLRSISQIDPLDDKNFLVRVGVNDYYLNKVKSRCRGAGRAFNRLQYTTSLSQLCSNEIIRVVDNSSGFTVGSCGLGKFHRLERKPPKEADETVG